jgi:hypothetical protein
MYEFLGYLRDLEYLIYIVLGSLAVWQLRKFYLAWEELRAAAFGLEKESAQLRMNRSAALLVVLLFLGTVEFGLVSFIIPAMPGVNPLPTPTIDLLATPTSTLVPSPDPDTTPASISSPLATDVIQTGCIATADSNNWLTVQAGDKPKEDEMLGFWDTTQLQAGNYYLRLVVIDNQGIQLDPCTVYLYIDVPGN